MIKRSEKDKIVVQRKTEELTFNSVQVIEIIDLIRLENRFFRVE